MALDGCGREGKDVRRKRVERDGERRGRKELWSCTRVRAREGGGWWGGKKRRERGEREGMDAGREVGRKGRQENRGK